MRGPATTIIRRSGTRALASGNAAITRRSSAPPTPEPPTVTMHTRSSSRYPSAARSPSAAGSHPVTEPAKS